MPSNDPSPAAPAAEATAKEGFQDEWFRPPEAAAYLKSTTSTLAKKRLKGDGPAYTKFGRLVLYGKRDLDAHLASRRRLSTSDAGPEAT